MCRGGCFGVSRKVSDTVIDLQLLSWADSYHFFRCQSHFSPFVLFGTHPESGLWKILFSGWRKKHSLLHPEFIWGLLSQVPSLMYCILPENSTSQRPCRWPLLPNSRSPSPFSVLFRPSQEHWLWPGNIIMEHIITLSGHEIHSSTKHFQEQME